ncbi:MAG: T9SS type A sorting domain-containing protein, partial [Bacteroidota bacterium]
GLVGKTSAYNSLLEISAADTKLWKFVGIDTPVVPILTTLSDIKANGEKYEARLIAVNEMQLTGTTDTMFLKAKTYGVIDPTDSSHAVALRIGNPGDTQIDSTKTPVKLFNFTGVLGQFSSSNPTAGYQLTPIYLGDIAAVEPALATLNPKVLDFGKVLLSHTKTDSATITNGGGSVLTVVAGVPSDTSFTVTPDSLSINPGDSAKVYVSFSTLDSNPTTATVVFTYGGGVGTDTLHLSGQGYSMSIPEVRRAPVGTAVVFSGAVTRAYGNYIYMQDDSAGIIIYAPTGTLRDTMTKGGIKFGTGLGIAGTTSEYNYLLEVAGSTITAWGFAGVDTTGWLHAIPVTLAEVKAHGEMYEARLIQVKNLTLTGNTDSLWAAKKTYSIVDPTDSSHAVALRTPNATDGEVDSTTVPAGPFMFTGVVGQFSFSDSAAGYQLMAILKGDIAENPLSVEEPVSNGLPTSYGLAQNYPNPFNPSTKIEFALPKASQVTLIVYNILGQEVATLANGMMAAGRYTYTFEARNLSSGLYFYRISAGDFNSVRKMMLVK